MKRTIFFMLFFLCIVLLAGCSTATEHEIISDKLGVNIGDGTIVNIRDSHGGFHGDGEAYAEITFPDASFENEIQNHSEWQTLPLTNPLSIVVYGGTLDNGTAHGSFIDDENDNPVIPKITNGYYYFEDRHRDSTNKKDDSQLFDRFSMNFTLALYDADTKTLYFYAFDS